VILEPVVMSIVMLLWLSGCCVWISGYECWLAARSSGLEASASGEASSISSSPASSRFGALWRRGKALWRSVWFRSRPPHNATTPLNTRPFTTRSMISSIFIGPRLLLMWLRGRLRRLGMVGVL